MKFKVNISDLNSKQQEIAEAIINTPASQTKYHILRASRQSGKTYLIERLAIYFALAFPGSKISFINALHTQNSKVFLEMIESISANLIKNSCNNNGGRYIELITNSVISFFSAKNFNAIVGSSWDFMFADEFALYPQDAWTYIQPTLASKQNAKCVISSTPRGRNMFHTLCMEGQNKLDTFKKEYRMSYLDNPAYDIREIEDAKRNRPQLVWRQEYEAEFIFGNSQVFGDFSNLQTITKWPAIKQENYFFGIDIAASGEDSTVLTIINERGEVVLIYETKSERLNDQAGELKAIILKYNAIGYGECNGLGLGLVESLQEMNVNIQKFWMSNESKQEMVTMTLKDMGSNNLILPSLELCPKLDNELATYEVSRMPSGKLHYEHAKGLHDDYVDSLMLANKAKNDFLFNRSGTWDPQDNIKTSSNWIDNVYLMRKYKDVDDVYDDIYFED